MKAPVKRVVIARANVERRSPGVSTGLMSDILVSIPPVNRMTLRAIIPMNCAPVGELNSSPRPSVPNNIPTTRKSRRVGTPKRNPVLLMRIPAKTITEPNNNIFPVVNTIFP